MELELPPELLRILDVPEREQSEPERRPNRSHDGHDPTRRKPSVEGGGSAIECRSGPPQHEEDRGKNDRFFVVATFEEGRHDAGDHGEDGEGVGGIEPACQSLRQHQQCRAQDTASKMRQLDNA